MDIGRASPGALPTFRTRPGGPEIEAGKSRADPTGLELGAGRQPGNGDEQRRCQVL